MFDAESAPLTNLLPLTVSVFLNNGTGAPCGTRTWEDVPENRDLSVIHQKNQSESKVVEKLEL